MTAGFGKTLPEGSQGILSKDAHRRATPAPQVPAHSGAFACPGTLKAFATRAPWGPGQPALDTRFALSRPEVLVVFGRSRYPG